MTDYRSSFQPGPLFGQAEKRTRERKAREYAKRDKLRAEIAAEMATPLNGTPVDRTLSDQMRRFVRAHKHVQTWGHPAFWRSSKA